MSRWDFGSDKRLARAVIVDEYGPDAVDVLEYLARTSRADDGRRVTGPTASEVFDQ